MSFLDAVIRSTDVGGVLTGGLLWSLRLGLLLAGTWMLAGALRRATAAVRHRLWVAGVVAALALPMIRSASPWRWDVTEMTGRPSAGPLETAGVPPAFEIIGAVASRSARGVAAVDRAAFGDARTWLAIWAAGTALALGMLALGSLRLAQIGRRARRPIAPDFDQRVRSLASTVGLDRAVPVLESDEIALPLTHGMVRPRILLPSGAVAGWPESRLDAVLLHELGHVRRRDVLTHVLGRVLCALHWFNPLVWAAATRMARECERACDDLVLGTGTRPSAYAAHLLAFVKAGRADPTLAPALGMARRSELEGRIVALLDPATVRGPVRRRAGATVIGVVLGLGLLISLPGVGAADRREEPTQEGGDRVPARDRLIGETLLRLLADSDASVREAAARSAGERRLGAAFQGLSAALEDPAADVREQAARALGQIRDPGAVPALAALVDHGGEPREVSEAAIDALGEIGTAEAVAVLGSALERASSSDLRDELVEALGETGRPEAVTVLGGLLDRADRRLQRRVLEALAEIESDAALGVVIGQLESADPNLRRMAAQALGGDR
jgi:beta-lactamase regulating signal transducer with metallopeptidase domain